MEAQDMKQTRKKPSPAFKAKVTLAARQRVGYQPGLGVLPASTYQSKRPGVDGADGPPAPDDPLLRVQEHGGLTGRAGLPGQPESRVQPDPADLPEGVANRSGPSSGWAIPDSVGTPAMTTLSQITWR